MNMTQSLQRLFVFSTIFAASSFLQSAQASSLSMPSSSASAVAQSPIPAARPIAHLTVQELFELALKHKTGSGVPKYDKVAVSLLESAADQNYAPAQVELGLCYEFGNGVAIDQIRAFKLYQDAARQGNKEAQNNLETMPDSVKQEWPIEELFEIGKRCSRKKNRYGALEFYEVAAKRGYAPAQCSLGCWYERYKKDETVQAFFWYKRAADQGYPKALYHLGVCYERGSCVFIDQKQAVEFYRQAADKGYAPAQYNLALCYEHGKGVVVDEEKAAELYQLSVAQHYAPAECSLGQCCQYGKGVAVNQKRAIELYQLSANQRYAPAYRFLGLYYEVADAKVAFEYYRLAAHHGDVFSQKKVAALQNQQNSNVVGNITTATHEFASSSSLARDSKKSVVQGVNNVQAVVIAAPQPLPAQTPGANSSLDVSRSASSPSQSGAKTAAAETHRHNYSSAASPVCSCGATMKRGTDNTEIWTSKSEGVLSLSSASSCSSSVLLAENLYELAECRRTGIGAEKDEGLAFKFYQLAAKRGHAKAQYNVAICYHSGRGVVADMAKAIEFYQMSSDRDYAQAQYKLGCCHDYGWGVIANKVNAIKLYQKAAEHGHRQAQYEIERVARFLVFAEVLFQKANSDQRSSGSSTSSQTDTYSWSMIVDKILSIMEFLNIGRHFYYLIFAG